MPTNAAAVPVLLPLLGALGALFVRRPSAGRRALIALLLTGLTAQSLWLTARALEAPLVLSLGGWVVPYGIVLVVDPLSGIMLCLSAVSALATTLYGYAAEPAGGEHPLRAPLFLLLTAGVNLAFVTGDLFNLFVAFEVLLLASYGLMTLELERGSTRRALPYVTINLIGSALFLCAAAFTYSLFGTLNFAEMASRAPALSADLRLHVLAVLLVLVGALKAGLFPLYHWLPQSYPVMPAPLTAFFAGLLTKVGVYVLIRLVAGVLPAELHFLHTALAWAGGVTMVVGVLGALAQDRVQHILAYHIVSQVGYMVLALGLFTPYAITAAIFYVVHHILAKTTLLLVGGVVQAVFGSDRLADTGGLARSSQVLSLTFLLQALSLAGVPPLSGFWGKLMIIQEGVRQGETVLVVLALVASLLTLLSMLKIWLASFWGPPPLAHESGDLPSEAQVTQQSPSLTSQTQASHPAAPARKLVTLTHRTRGMIWVIAGLTAMSLGVGLGAGPLVSLADQAATRVLDHAATLEAVRALNRSPEPGKHP
ncbi:MAG: Na+/H+ antiporter subunit D [Polyangiaceae bacterium]|nr:Na+/H+ antiporter subunit D [Polyangiaceae bacterium]MCW5789469.1 Na+/H+ antiporter subunit D [Polyangiaceae bacterium]